MAVGIDKAKDSKVESRRAGISKTKLDRLTARFRSAVTKAIFYELVATPKPGLVDALSPNAHADMDIFTFVDSAASIIPYFEYLFREGLVYRGKISSALARYRFSGIEAEKKMLAKTLGANTHRGLIFIIGLVSLAAGILFARRRRLRRSELGALVREMTERTLDDELRLISGLDSKTSERELSHGEKVYRETGVSGARGEAMRGLPTVLDVALPSLEKLIAEHREDKRAALLTTLVEVISKTEDTNVLFRTSRHVSEKFRQLARETSAAGGLFTKTGLASYNRLLKFAMKNKISPGGAADLLASALLVLFLENIEGKEQLRT
jgi:triphosphoribosyl-dephospho-CoA synthase